MRLYLKLVAMIGSALMTQRAIRDDATEWLDEAQFTVRVYVAVKLGEAPAAPELVEAADRLTARRRARLGWPPLVVGPPAGPLPAGMAAAAHVGDEPVAASSDDPSCLCEPAGES